MLKTKKAVEKIKPMQALNIYIQVENKYERYKSKDQLVNRRFKLKLCKYKNKTKGWQIWRRMLAVELGFCGSWAGANFSFSFVERGCWYAECLCWTGFLIICHGCLESEMRTLMLEFEVEN